MLNLQYIGGIKMANSANEKEEKKQQELQKQQEKQKNIRFGDF